MKPIWYIRQSISRHLIHLGLWIMPDGRAKRELLTMLWNWRIHVNRVVHENRKHSD